MVAHLCLFTGAAVTLAPGDSRTFGRTDCGKPLEKVSRQQFRLDCSAEGVRATALSAVNPAKVWLAGGGGAVLLSKGESRLLGRGDRVLLLACDPSMFIELLGWEEPRPSKRARLAAAAAAGTQQPSGQQQQQQPQNGGGDGAAAPPGQAQQQPQAQQEGEQQQQPQPQQQQGQQQQQQPQGQQQDQQEGAGPAAPAGALHQVMLVLVGLPGSGKSTFCFHLRQKVEHGAEQGQAQQDQQQQQQGPAVPDQAAPDQAQQGQQQQGQQQQGPHPAAACPRWVRINQDSIANGRRGTKEQCLEVAHLALQRGESVLIDRTNVDQDQRRPFLRLAREMGAQAHCLFLKLPKKTCMSRAAARAGHEGDLQGNAAFPAVNRFNTLLEEAGDPQLREGFASVLVCESDAEVAAALEAWSLFSPAHPDPAAEYACLKPPPPKQPVLNTLDRFLVRKPKEGEAAAGPQAAGTGAQAGGAAQQQQQQQQQQPLAPAGRTAGSSGGGAGGGNALQALMAASRQQAQQAKSPPADAARPSGGPAGGGASSAQQQRHNFASGGDFANSLVNIARNPESCRREQPHLSFDERCVLIQDKFPKARQHWLVVARDPRLGGPLDLTAGDAPLVEHMLDVARRQTAKLQGERPGLQFRFGFHSVPSLRQLHLHVISQDFDSAGLKNKKHWNSFTHPSFWLDASAALAALRGPAGCLQYDLRAAEEALKADLRCHRCGARQSTMPALKQHIAACKAPPPGQQAPAP